MTPPALLLAVGAAALIQAGLIFWAFGVPGGVLRRSAAASNPAFAAVMGRFQAAAVALAIAGLAAAAWGVGLWR